METTQTTETAEVIVYRKQAASLADQAASIVITNEHSFEAATVLLGEIKTYVVGVRKFFKPLKDTAYAAHKAVCAKENDVLAEFEAADRRLRPAWVEYNREQERKRREEEDRLRREAQKKLDEEAERQRVARQKELEDEALREAEETGDESVLESVPEVRAEAPVAPPVAIARPKTRGVSVRRTPDFEIVDVARIPREYMLVDEKKIRQIVKALGERTNIPGVRVFMRDDIAVKAKV